VLEALLVVVELKYSQHPYGHSTSDYPEQPVSSAAIPTFLNLDNYATPRGLQLVQESTWKEK
jgi:hypothetical protein